MKRRKIAVIGAGNVGGATAQRLAEVELGDVVLLDISEGIPQGKALDLSQAVPIYGTDVRLAGTNGYAETADSDIVVITSGVPRKPGMSRDDLLRVNTQIVRAVVEEVARCAPRAILIVVSNPLDAMTHVAYRISRFPRERVIGMAGVLDSARFRSFIAQELDVSVHNVHASVLGGHGDTMVPLPRYTTVAGVPVTELIPRKRLEAIVRRAREGGAEIVNLLKTGSAFYAPSASVVEMVDAILHDRKKILPCAVLCQGEYGVSDLFMGVPAKLGLRGMEGIFEVPLNDEERAALRRSAEAVRELRNEVDKLLS